MPVWRDQHETQLRPTIGTMPEQQRLASLQKGSEPGGEPQAASALGLKLAPLTPVVRRRLGLEPQAQGVVVAGVAQDSAAAAIGIEPGDVIMAVNQQPVDTPAQAADKLNEVAKSANKHVLLLLNRHGSNEFVGFSVEHNQG
jgi:serine protease Do